MKASPHKPASDTCAVEERIADATSALHACPFFGTQPPEEHSFPTRNLRTALKVRNPARQQGRAAPNLKVLIFSMRFQSKDTDT